jgi:Tol biopolymer transport system component
MASEQQKSASFPVISPDGRYLLFTIHDYGTFPIWHRDADLCLVELATGKQVVQETINSGEADSFHSWSKNSRWVIFSSRRYDGRYTRLYISYLDPDGQFRKPFLLPQKDPGFYDSFFYSYNKPEMIDGPVQVSQRRWIKAANK